VLLFCVFAATHAYFWLGVREGPGDILDNTISVVYRLFVLGDFDQFELQGTDPEYAEGGDGTLVPNDALPTKAHFLIVGFFYMVTVLGSVGLMHISIGVLGSNCERHPDKSVVHFLGSRAKILAEFTMVPRKRCFMHDVAFQRSLRITDPNKEDALVMIRRVTQASEDGIFSLRTHTHTRLLHEQMEARLMQKLQQMEERMA